MVKTSKKPLRSKSKKSLKRGKPKPLKPNEKKLSAKDQNALQKISEKEKAAKKKYGGKSPARLRDPQYTDHISVGDGLIEVYLDTSAIPDVKVRVYEQGVKRSGGSREVKRAARKGIWRRQNHWR